MSAVPAAPSRTRARGLSTAARVRVASAGLGVGFGFLLSWGRLTDPGVIRSMLLLEDAYVYLMMASAVAVGFVGVRLVRGRLRRALITGERIGWPKVPVERRHFVGSVLFGTGWALSSACPGPITAQLGQGQLWALCTAGGVILGLIAFSRNA